MRAGCHRVVKEPYLSGLDQWGLTPRLGDIEHKVQRPTQQLSQGADGPREAKGFEPPHAERSAVGDAFLVVAVGPFTGGTRPRQTLPRRGATWDRPNEARLVFAWHAVAIAQHARGVRACLLLLGRTGPATHVWPRVGLVVVPIGATPTATGGLRRAVGLIASAHEGRRIEVCVARILVKDR